MAKTKTQRDAYKKMVDEQREAAEGHVANIKAELRALTKATKAIGKGITEPAPGPRITFAAPEGYQETLDMLCACFPFYFDKSGDSNRSASIRHAVELAIAHHEETTSVHKERDALSLELLALRLTLSRIQSIAGDNHGQYIAEENTLTNED